MAERSNAPDCKSGEASSTRVRVSLSPHCFYGLTISIYSLLAFTQTAEVGRMEQGTLSGFIPRVWWFESTSCYIHKFVFACCSLKIVVHIFLLKGELFRGGTAVFKTAGEGSTPSSPADQTSLLYLP